VQGSERYVIFAHLALGILAAITIGRILGGIAYLANVDDPALIGGGLTLTTLIGAVIGLGGAFYAYRHATAHEFSTDVIAELRKVTWPSTKETQTATIVVIITSIILALVMGFFDLVWAQLTGLIYHT
jgi:preprotein translocase subunit SecE